MLRATAIATTALCLLGCQHSPKQIAEVAPLAKFVPKFLFRGSARLGGTIGIYATCIVLIEDDGHRSVPIWTAAARLERDGEGWLIRDLTSGEVLRPGDRVVGGGGVLIGRDGSGWSRSQVNAVVDPDIPENCGGGVVSFHSFHSLHSIR